MKDYCRIFISIKDDNAYISSTDIVANEREKLLEGIPLKTNSLTAQVKNKTKKYPDFMGNGSDLLVVSENFKKILESKKNQFIPVDVNKKKYWLVNILNVVSCLDWDKSVYTTFSNPKIIKDITILVLKKEALKGIDIFRMKEDPVHVFISKSLHDIIVENKLTGVMFIDSNDLTKNED